MLQPEAHLSDFQPVLLLLSLGLAALGASLSVHVVRVLPDFTVFRRRQWRVGGGLLFGLCAWGTQYGAWVAWNGPHLTGFHLGWALTSLTLPVLSGVAFLLLMERHLMGVRRLDGRHLPWASLCLSAALLGSQWTGLQSVGASPTASLDTLLAAAAVIACTVGVCLWGTRHVTSKGWRRRSGLPASLALFVAMVVSQTLLPAALHGEVAPAAQGWPWLSMLTMAQLMAVLLLVGLLLPLALLVKAQQEVQHNIEQVADLQETNQLLEARAVELSRDLVAVQRQADAKRAAMMETAAVNFFEIRVDEGHITFAERCLHLGGHRRHVLSSQQFNLLNWHQQVHPDDAAFTARRMEDCINGLTDSFESPYRIKVDGHSWRWLMARARVVEWTTDRRPVVLYGTLIDVHEDRCRQLALDEERQMLTTGPVVMVRVVGQGGQFRFNYVSDNVGKLWGHDASALMSQPSWLSIVHGQDVEPVREAFQRSLAQAEQTSLDVELRLRMADGSWRWFRYSSLINPAASEHRGYFVDIDARKQAELEASTQRQRLQEMVLQLEAAQDEGGVLQDTSDMLHATERMQEAFDIIRLSALRLFPGWSGQVCASRDGSSDLEIGAQWGAGMMSPEGHFEGSDCWGIRRGKAHSFFSFETSVCCPHMRHVPPQRMRPYICVPMAAHGETVGSLNLYWDDGPIDEAQMQRVQQRASRFAETLKLAMSNLKLRTSLQNQAMTDSLTGLYNRRYLDESLVQELQRSRRNGQPVSLAMIDVDHFKRFNDSFGHDAGDAVLRELAATLQGSTRGYDIACRYGGEEMAIIMPGCDVADAQTRIEQVRTLVAQLQVRHGGVTLPPVTISAGVAEALGGDPNTLIRRADEALYEAKCGGRNQVRIAPTLSLASVMGEFQSERASVL